MNRDDIVKWTREAGMHRSTHNLASNPVQHLYSYDGYEENLERFVALVAAAERERACRIVTGLCISDNNAREINEAIREQA